MQRLGICAAVLCASLFGSAAHAAYSGVFVFGDSLSDNGNVFRATFGEIETVPYTDLIPDRAYSSQRLSNGPVWVDLLGPRVSVAPIAPSLAFGTNFAFGGARSGPLTGVTPDGIPTLQTQVDTLLNFVPQLPADALYVVWGAGNDARDAAVSGSTAAAQTIMADSLGNIGEMLGTLAGAGARQFLVPNMPDLSRTPAVIAQGQDAQTGVHALVQGYNSGLAGLLAALDASPTLDIMTLDIYALITTVLDHPADFGFTNVTAPCHFENAGQGCSNPDEYFFWDGLHPTSAVHRLIADAVTATVAPIPVPATLPLLASALAVTAVWWRRRAA